MPASVVPKLGLSVKFPVMVTVFTTTTSSRSSRPDALSDATWMSRAGEGERQPEGLEAERNWTNGLVAPRRSAIVSSRDRWGAGGGPRVRGVTGDGAWDAPAPQRRNPESAVE